ncbi:rhodanese-related sulfurtransferase [Herbihabitans rhizosphaerae]|uniref:Rhodanese-related sulfurtransferase n=1 Tax=Herbihabitans rhizosphaerae TaxID=1872711 RepID=A0A4Q7KHY9_9PSEU|nr:rhodanese-like domain-containing protein [Herbihabitans rhizosphaerae]RZS34923.1 rhodanese-related sulfurtransferase [Herbihabitans rhizosphaerae]
MAQQEPAYPKVTDLDGTDPMTTDAVPHISRTDLLQGIQNKTVTVVDTLPVDMHVRQHLPGSLSIVGFPYEEATARTGEAAPKLLPDKSAKIALYCINVPCRNSEYVGRQLIRLGYKNVYKYAEGIQDWARNGLPTEKG